MTDLERARAWTGFDATGKLSQHRFLLESGRQEQLDAYEEQLREMRKEWEAMLDAARREGAVAERANIDEMLDVAYQHGAEEMRERAARILDEDAPWAARAIRALPLTPEEPT